MLKKLLLTVSLISISFAMEEPNKIDWPPASGAWMGTFVLEKMCSGRIEHTPTGLFQSDVVSIMGEGLDEKKTQQIMNKWHSDDVNPLWKKRFTPWSPEGLKFVVNLSDDQKPMEFILLTSHTREEFSAVIDQINQINLPPYFNIYERGFIEDFETRYALTEEDERFLAETLQLGAHVSDQIAYQDLDGFAHNDTIEEKVLLQISQKLPLIPTSILRKMIGSCYQDLGDLKNLPSKVEQLQKSLKLLESEYALRQDKK